MLHAVTVSHPWADAEVLQTFPRPYKAPVTLTQGFDFADALHHASSRQCDALATFDDKGFAQRAAAKGWVPKVLVP